MLTDKESFLFDLCNTLRTLRKNGVFDKTRELDLICQIRSAESDLQLSEDRWSLIEEKLIEMEMKENA